jgi:hypothetical protein
VVGCPVLAKSGAMKGIGDGSSPLWTFIVGCQKGAGPGVAYPTIAMSRPIHLAAAAAASRPNTLAAAASAAAAANAGKGANELLPPALKGIAVGFLGGVIAIVALMMLAPTVTRHDDMTGAGQNQTESRTHGKMTASPVGVRQ